MRKIFLLPVFMAGCSFGPSGLIKKSMLLEPGQTKQDVLDALGAPKDRQFQDKNEAWQYCRTAWELNAQDDFVLVWFYDGYVTGVETRKSGILGNCASQIESIRWENAPDATVELRNR